MSRPIIICPSCHRELYHLHRPQCSWCGADLSEEQFERVALPLGDMPATDLPPLIPETPLTGFGSRLKPFSQNPFSLIQRPVSPFKWNLKIVGIVFIICLILGDIGYGMWQSYQRYQKDPPLSSSHQTR